MFCDLGTKMCTVCLKQFNKPSYKFSNPDISALKTSCPGAVVIENYDYVLITI